MNNKSIVFEFKDFFTLLEHSKTVFLKEGKENIFFKGKECDENLTDISTYRQVLSIYAKQHNLIKSTIILLEHNMPEEAYIQARSMLNSYFLINYLLNDNKEKERLKKYIAQPLKNSLNNIRATRKLFHKEWFEDERNRALEPIREKAIEMFDNIEKNLVEKGVHKQKLIKIWDLVKDEDKEIKAFYGVIYGNASRYEHADPHVVDFYTEPLKDNSLEIENSTINTNKKDENLEERICGLIQVCFQKSFLKITNHMETNNKKLLEKNYTYEELEKLKSHIFEVCNEWT